LGRLFPQGGLVLYWHKNLYPKRFGSLELLYLWAENAQRYKNKQLDPGFRSIGPKPKKRPKQENNKKFSSFMPD
jgi:hypothetical protein